MKAPVDQAVREGHYAAKQIFCKDRLIAWSHRRRFAAALDFARRFRGRHLLDYGCGDGTFLALLAASSEPPASAVGAELDAYQVNDCRARLAHLTGVRFEKIAALDEESQRERYDGVVCMEVLEHVVKLDDVIDRLWRVLRQDGTLIVSVPVETGLPLLLKQLVRGIAALRGVGDYGGANPYTAREYFASVFAGSAPHMTRPVYDEDGEMPFHDHKGFNWRVLRDRLARRFIIDEIATSPVTWLGPQFATQVWFVARKKPV